MYICLRHHHMSDPTEVARHNNVLEVRKFSNRPYYSKPADRMHAAFVFETPKYMPVYCDYIALQKLWIKRWKLSRVPQLSKFSLPLHTWTVIPILSVIDLTVRISPSAYTAKVTFIFFYVTALPLVLHSCALTTLPPLLVSMWHRRKICAAHILLKISLSYAKKRSYRWIALHRRVRKTWQVASNSPGRRVHVRRNIKMTE